LININIIIINRIAALGENVERKCPTTVGDFSLVCTNNEVTAIVGVGVSNIQLFTD
jgi:hypothetical protein